MPSYFDIYVISSKRDLETIDSFLTEFVPQREESASEYEFPQYADKPEAVYLNAKTIISMCCSFPELSYGLYWRTPESIKPEHAMVFFLEDGNVIYGLSTDDAYPEYAKKILEKLKQYLGSELGYIGHEASPDAENLEEFRAQIEAHKSVLQ